MAEKKKKNKRMKKQRKEESLKGGDEQDGEEGLLGENLTHKTFSFLFGILSRFISSKHAFRLHLATHCPLASTVGGDGGE